MRARTCPWSTRGGVLVTARAGAAQLAADSRPQVMVQTLHGHQINTTWLNAVQRVRLPNLTEIPRSKTQKNTQGDSSELRALLGGLRTGPQWSPFREGRAGIAGNPGSPGVAETGSQGLSNAASLCPLQTPSQDRHHAYSSSVGQPWFTSQDHTHEKDVNVTPGPQLPLRDKEVANRFTDFLKTGQPVKTTDGEWKLSWVSTTGAIPIRVTQTGSLSPIAHLNL